jgi:hypothetical protein
MVLDSDGRDDIMTAADYIAIAIVSILLILTCFVSHERGMEASSLRQQVAALEKRLDDLRPIPRINVKRASIYSGSGEIIMQTVETKGE